MPQQPIAVLKFGSSVLRAATDYPAAVAEIQWHRERGNSVVANDDADDVVRRFSLGVPFTPLGMDV